MRAPGRRSRSDAEAWALTEQWFPLAWGRMCRVGFRGPQEDAKQEVYLALFQQFQQAPLEIPPPTVASGWADKVARVRCLQAETGAKNHDIQKWRGLAKGATPEELGLTEREAADLISSP